MELSVELKRDDGMTRTAVKLLSQVTDKDIELFIAEQIGDGWAVQSWVIKPELPADEGYIEARAGKPVAANPYAEHYWRHAEWEYGWNLFHEND